MDLYRAITSGQEDKVRLLLDLGADVNIQESQHETALYAAAAGGYIEIVRLLLEKGAEINTRGGEYGTALQAAASSGHTEIVRLLLEKGADVNTQGGIFGTALQDAVALGHIEIVRLLLEKGADVNTQGGIFGTALQDAVSLGHIEIIRLLLEKGADINTQGGEFGTALQTAISRGYSEIARLLLEKGADVNAEGGKFGTAPQTAISRGYSEIARLLLEKGADVNAEGGKFESALLAAILDGNVPITKLLLDEYGDKIPITEKVLEKVVKLSKNVVQLLSLLLQKEQGRITITKEIFMSATESEKGGEILALLLESSIKMSEDIIWVRDLGKVGYSTQEIVELFLDHKNDSPWIYFESTGIPCLDIQTDRHIPGCCHAVSPREGRQRQISNTLFESRQTNLDHQEIIFQIQELCGLAGVKPTTRKITDWVGHIELSDSDRSLSVSYALPTDKKTPTDFRIIWSRIARALEGFYQAAALMQANNLCCDSFTILKSGSPGHDPSSSSLGEIISVSFKSVLELIEELQDFMNLDSEFPNSERLLLSASTAILELIWPDIPKVPGGSSVEWCLHLCALAAQFLCLGLLSYSQAHIGPLQPFFLDSFSRQIRIMGLDREHLYPFVVVELVSLSCLDNMTRGQVLLFYNSQTSPQKRFSETQIQRLMQSHDIFGPC
ncbi:hypothetical protein N7486_005359 [Penicillium sp. IBT 16267x]|nr:hypothetical protein N7486_005359 [Penicillium sp. IBT 16267x]